MMTNTETKRGYPSLGDAKDRGKAWLAANPAALEIEFTVRLGTDHTIQIWVQRDGSAFDKPQHGEAS